MAKPQQAAEDKFFADPLKLWSFIVVVAGGALLLIVAVATATYYYIRRKRKKGRSELYTSHDAMGGDNTRNPRHEQLEAVDLDGTRY